jgi:hypothetical protein
MKTVCHGMKRLLSVCHSLKALGNLIVLNSFMIFINKLEIFKKAIVSEFKTLSLNLYKENDEKR